jgi:predicted RecA/RadA family phage recombinase
MAKNRRYESGDNIPLPVPEGTKSGGAVVVGALPAVAHTDRKSDGTAGCQCNGVYDFKVTGKNKAGEKAIEAGDIVYLMADGTINVNNEEGKRFGYACAPVVKNKTETIPVKIGL